MQARIPAAAALGLAALCGHATAADWPGAAPCNGTLDACIDATPDGSTVRIVTDGPIDENVNLYNRNLTLTAAPGVTPRFASGRWISASVAPIAGDQTVTLSGLTLTNGYVILSYGGAGTGRYDVRDMTIEQTLAGAPAYIRVAASGGSTVEATVYRNRVTGTPLDLDRGLIELLANGATLNASALYNRVTSPALANVPGAGIFVNATADAGGTAKLHANEARGSFQRGSFLVSEGLSSTTTSNYAARLYNNVAVCAATTPTAGGGIRFAVGNGTLNAQAVNNTVSRCSLGVTALRWDGATGAGAAIDGLVKNNLIVADTAFVFDTALTASVSNDYNLINGGVAGTTPGAHTITAPAQLADASAPRLKSTSPAIDAADTSTLGFGLIFNGLPIVDADGLRRIKATGGGDDADIGAYEYGDLSFRHTATPANTINYISTFDDPASNDRPGANLVATPNFRGGPAGPGVVNDNAFGVYVASQRWRVFNENTAVPMPNGATFNVFAPAPDNGSFRHVSTAANVSGRFTTIDSGSTNGVPNYIVLATQNWSAGSGIYNPHPVGVVYDAATGRWRIANLDATGDPMPANAGFNVYAQPESPNAFRVTATGGTQSIVLYHPLLDGVPCAQVNTTRVWSGAAVAGNHDVYYGDDGTWRIFAYSPMTAGTTFHVVVDPRQVFECTDRIFANGFQ
ncbi:MAG TPA: choice-of-anchor Q domain-containing protein [Tahibacter sp.]|nr:choice-of-anchor Q domain-containing protein [Tahibacter sp.]